MTTDLLNQLLDHALDLNLVLNEKYEIIYANRAAKSMLAFEKQELLGVSFFSLVHNDDRPSVERTINQVLRHREDKQHVTFRLKHKEKGWRIFEAHCWYNSTESRARILFCAHDVTNRVMAQKELIEKEEQLARAQRTANIGNWELNLNTSEITASSQYYRLFGIAPQESISLQAIMQYVHPDDREMVKTVVREAQESMGTINFRHRILRTDGALRHVNVQGKTEYYGDEFIMYGVIQDITEQVEREEMLMASRQRLSDLTAQLHRIQEEERARLAREVHDVLGQATTALRLDIHWIKENGPKDDEQFQQRAGRTLSQIEETIAMVRRISHELRPGILDHLGIGAALEWMSGQYEERTDLTFTVRNDIEDDLEDIEPDLATALFRVFQEAVTNVIRHANANTVNVRLFKDKHDLVLEIEDDGKGICESDLKESSSLGVLNMKERVMPWQGTFTINGNPGTGTLIKVSVPGT